VLTRFDFERAFVRSMLPGGAKQVLHVLAMRLDKDVFHIPAPYQPSLNDLARDMTCDRRTVMRRLNRAESAGWVIRKRPSKHDARTKHARTSYFLRLPPDHEQARDNNADQLGTESPQPEGMKPPGLEAAKPEARGTAPLKSSRSSSSSGPSDLDVIIAGIEKRTGRTIGRAWAARVRDELLAKATSTVRNTQAYLKSSIEREADPGRWLPNPQPPSSKQVLLDTFSRQAFPEE
jgi:hypothetical protein